MHTALGAALKRAEDGFCLDVSEGSLCALLLCGLGAERVVSVEPKMLSNLLLSQLCEANGFAERWNVIDTQPWATFSEDVLEGQRISLLCAEPFYYQVHFVSHCELTQVDAKLYICTSA